MTSTSKMAHPSVANRGPALMESALLAWVLEGTSAPSRFNVLDVGPAMPRTIKFLNSTRCRVHIADLFDSGIIEQQKQLDQDALTARFAEALWMLDEPLHACLLWDFPNYLTPSALAAFNQALSPWVTGHTRAHAFCAVKGSDPLMQHRYSIRSVNKVVQKAAPERPPAAHPHPWRHLARAMSVFDVDRGALRAEGVVEVILHGKAERSAEPPLRTNEQLEDILLPPSLNAAQRPFAAERKSQQTEPRQSAPRAFGQ